jgi:8-oxo-dGTP pyrophosphatase MutT (NUDIX family)
MSDGTGEAVGPWRRLSSDMVYENPWIRVFHENVLTPAGTPGIYGRVHFRNQAIGIVAIDADEHVFLVKQFRYARGHYSLEIPKGGGARDVEPLEIARRELKEETGFSAAKWQHLLELQISNSVTDQIGHVFVAEQLTAGEQLLDDSEDIEVIRVPLKQAVAMACDGRITDDFSVVSLLRVALLRQVDG